MRLLEMNVAEWEHQANGACVSSINIIILFTYIALSIVVETVSLLRFVLLSSFAPSIVFSRSWTMSTVRVM